MPTDRTAKARIRDAALARFAAEGFSAASVKDIAADAGVSAPLVMHHFGTKDGLRAACDDYVVALIRDRKIEAVEAGAELDAVQALRKATADPTVFRYLIRTLSERSSHVDSLIDTMVDNAVEYTTLGIERGIVKPVANVREITTVLTIWSLGTLVFHEQFKRLLDIDLVDGDHDDYARWLQAVAPLYANGIIDPDYMEHLSTAMLDATPSEGELSSPHP